MNVTIFSSKSTAAAAVAALAPGQTATLIFENGSRWFPQKPADVPELIALLSREMLDPDFEQHGNFIDVDPRPTLPRPIFPEGFVHFWGNFRGYSHVFDLATNDPETIAALTRAIRANQGSSAYIAVKRLAA